MYSKEVYRDYLIDQGTFDGYGNDFTIIKIDEKDRKDEHPVVVCQIQTQVVAIIKNIHITPGRFNKWFIEKRNEKINEILYG